MLECKRDLFDLPSNICFFNAAAWSPLPKSTVEEGVQGVIRKSRPWDFPANHEKNEIERARQAAARLINAAPEDIAIISSVSYGVATAAKILDLPTRSRIMVLENDHSSPVLEWHSRNLDDALEIETIRPGENRDWTSAILDAVSTNGKRPAELVSISSVHWSDGARIDLEKVQNELKKLGSMLLVDATQAVGVEAVDVATLDPDFLIFPTYKWLLGPYGRAFIYIAKRHRNATPLEQTAHGRKRVNSQDSIYLSDTDFVEDASRFDMGERDFFVSLGMASHSMELIQSWGTDQVRERMMMLTRRIANALDERNLPVKILPEKFRAPHILSLEFPDGMPRSFDKTLARQNVFAANRLGRLRISPHVYNNEADCDRLVSVLEDALK